MTQTDSQNVSQDDSDKQALSRGDIETLQKSFAEEGYFVLRNVVSQEKLSGLRTRILDEFEQTKHSGSLFSGGGLLSGHLNCFPGEESRFAYDTLQERGIIDLIKAIMPKAERAPNVGCNLNLPNSAIQHYHADRGFTQEFMIANVAVVDTVVENGAIELIPGTHKKFYKYWRFALERPYRASIRVPMKQGDVLVRSSNVWHRGMPNYSAVARPMIALTWEDGGSQHDDPFRVEDGQIKFRPNWFKPTLAGRLRERTFVKFPFTYSACRFVSSLYGNKGY